MAPAEWECREDEPVRDAVGMDDVDRMIAVDAEQLACSEYGKTAVLHDVGADPRSLMALDWLTVELGSIEFATSWIAVTLQGDDAHVPAGGDRGAGGATNARVLIYIGVHHER
jgi:hypothetical protein